MTSSIITMVYSDLFDVVQRLLTSLESHDDGLRDHH